MSVNPKNYNKEEFIKFLLDNHVDIVTIEKFSELPNVIKKNNNTYYMYIYVTFYDTKNIYYTYELNYYSNELIEFLFSSKVFNDVKYSINNLYCDLLNSRNITQ
jgi:hypothetical protein